MKYRDLPQNIQEKIKYKNGLTDNIGMSNANVTIYEDMVLKSDINSTNLKHEYVMLKWLSNKIPVPKIIQYDDNHILMSKIEGELSCADIWLSNSTQLMKILAQGLKKLWDVPIDNCPYKIYINDKLSIEEKKIQQGLYSNNDSEAYNDSGFSSADALLCWLKENKPSEDLVFSHGDFCLPNIFINQDKISGFIDLGQSGIADRYRDIALCYRSLKENLSGVYSGTSYKFDIKYFFDELGIIPDYNKINYYILLDELY